MKILSSLQSNGREWSERLLPGELQTPPVTERTVRDWVVDWAMFVLSLGLSFAMMYDEWPGLSLGWIIATGVVAVAASASLFWRRSHPKLLMYTLIPLSAVTGAATGPSIAVIFNTALRLPLREIAIAFALNTAAIAVYMSIYPYAVGGSGNIGNFVLGVVFTAGIIAWGLLARSRRELLVSIRAQAASVQAERQLRDEQAKEAERRRIAREMHDVLAHRISILSLHAGALEYRPDATPEEITEAARVIRESARDALTELREVIGVLRSPVQAQTPEPPQPTINSLPLLVEDFQAAGLRIEFDAADLPPDTASDATSRAAYRVVQEGLVNASKHAANSTTRIESELADGHLCVKVINKLPVGPGPERTNGAVVLEGSGVGLVGLAERVELAGGKLSYGATAAGEFVLSATLPWESA